MRGHTVSVFPSQRSGCRSYKDWSLIRQVPLPPLFELQKYEELVEKIDSLLTRQRQSEQELETLFNSLMQRAFRGELVP